MRTARSSNRGGISTRHSPWDQTPPQSRHPLGADTPRSRHPPGAGTPPDQTPLPPGAGTPLWTESQTPVKTLPSRNFVCGR